MSEINKWKVYIDIEDARQYILDTYGELNKWFKNNSMFWLYSDDKTTFCTPRYVSITDDDNYPTITVKQFKEITSVPKRLSFYIKYTPEFTEDLFNKLMQWCKDNTKGCHRGLINTYKTLSARGSFDVFFVFDNYGFNVTKYDKATIEHRLSYGLDNNIQGCKEKYTIQQVKELINYKENMEKEKFTIEGSVALKKAFVEELGIEKSSTFIITNYLCPSAHQGKLGTRKNKDYKHFILPQQWNEALEYVKEYFTEEEFKIGDKVVILNNNHMGNLLIGSVGTIISDQNNPKFSIKGIMKSGEVGIWYYSGEGDIRKATPEEIKKAQEPKYKEFPLGGYTAKVTKDVVLVDGKGRVKASDWIKLFSAFGAVDCGSYDFTVNTFNIGCVKNITLRQYLDVYTYLTT
jgi:hypothetical protein